MQFLKTLKHIVRQYTLAHIFIICSLILHCIACCSQIHPISIIHIFKDLGSDLLCFHYSVQYIFLLPFQHYFPMQNLIQNSFIVIFVYQLQHLLLVCVCGVAEIVSVNSSLVPM